ncbi:DNA-binding protein [Metabacillus halosaccharovorans]|nr:DNA-binding protein [Metabacillus halosaccharovorans]
MKSIEEYSDVLSVQDIQEILSIGRHQAYEFVLQENFIQYKLEKELRF